MKETCGGCGKAIIWAAITKADGKPGKVPLDPVPPVYRLPDGCETVSDNCRGCERPVVWVVLGEEAGVPVEVELDPTAPVYRYHRDERGEVHGLRDRKAMVLHASTCSQVSNLQLPELMESKRDREAAVSHFRTCPNASEFSASRRRPASSIPGDA